MLDSLYIAATGMHAQQRGVDTIANNLANVNTNGFKRSRIGFADLIGRALPAQALAGADGSAALAQGNGVAIGSSQQIFAGGDLKKTDQPLDLAVRGSGFFEVLLPDGSHAYTRAGSFQLDREGILGTALGHALNPTIQVPAEASAITVDASGLVTATVPNEAQPVELGRIELVSFMNPGGLRPLGDNLYQATEQSGDAVPGKPGEQSLGSIAQGYVESSNVKLVDEFIGLMVAQRAYEASAKAVQASDEMLGLVNNLRR